MRWDYPHWTSITGIGSALNSLSWCDECRSFSRLSLLICALPMGPATRPQSSVGTMRLLIGAFCGRLRNSLLLASNGRERIATFIKEHPLFALVYTNSLFCGETHLAFNCITGQDSKRVEERYRDASRSKKRCDPASFCHSLKTNQYDGTYRSPRSLAPCRPSSM